MTTTSVIKVRVAGQVKPRSRLSVPSAEPCNSRRSYDTKMVCQRETARCQADRHIVIRRSAPINHSPAVLKFAWIISNEPSVIFRIPNNEYIPRRRQAKCEVTQFSV